MIKQTKKRVIERRRTRRRKIAATVLLRHPALGEQKMKMTNMSDGGIFLAVGHNVPPPVGAVIEVLIKPLTGLINERPVMMEVVHRRDDGLGLKFLSS